MQDPQQTDMQTDIESVIHQDELQTVPTDVAVTRSVVSNEKGRVKVPATNGNGKTSNFRLNNAPGLPDHAPLYETRRRRVQHGRVGNAQCGHLQ